MTDSNPLGRIKDITAGSLKFPFVVAGAALQVTRTVTSKAASTAASLITHDRAPSATPATPASAEQPTAQEKAPNRPVPAQAPDDDAPTSAKSTPDQPEPVNVTEELGLDPAPVEKKKPSRAKPAKKAATGIDAEADPDHVDATPADVAKAVAKDVPADD